MGLVYDELQSTPQQVYVVGLDALQGPFFSLNQAKMNVDLDLMDTGYSFAIIPPYGDVHRIIEAVRADVKASHSRNTTMALRRRL